VNQLEPFGSLAACAPQTEAIISFKAMMAGQTASSWRLAGHFHFSCNEIRHPFSFSSYVLLYFCVHDAGLLLMLFTLQLL